MDFYESMAHFIAYEMHIDPWNIIDEWGAERVYTTYSYLMIKLRNTKGGAK